VQYPKQGQNQPGQRSKRRK